MVALMLLKEGVIPSSRHFSNKNISLKKKLKYMKSLLKMIILIVFCRVLHCGQTVVPGEDTNVK